MKDWPASLKKKFAPNVDIAALLIGTTGCAIAVLPILAAVDIIHQPDSAFHCGRGAAFIGGMVLLSGGAFLAFGKGLGGTTLMRKVRQPVILGLVSLMLMSFTAVPCYLLATGAQGHFRLAGPIGVWYFQSPILSKFVFISIAIFCAVLSVASVVDFVHSLKVQRR